MTTFQTRVGPWTVRPGWGIAVDLTPPQLAKERRVRSVRKLVAAGLGLVVAGCAAAYVLATREHAAAQDALAQVQVQTTQVQADLGNYDSTVEIQSTVAGVRQQISAAMSGDVATDELLARIRAALPGDMTVEQASVTVSLASVAATTPATGLEDSSHPRIGDITLSGTGHTLSDLSEFVAHLQEQPGFVDIVPTSNTAGQGSVEYNLTLGFTDQLRTHLFDVTQAGTK